MKSYNYIVLSLLAILPNNIYGQFITPQYVNECNKLPQSSMVQSSFYLSRPASQIRYQALRPGCNITDSTKLRLMQLLDWQWSKEELEAFMVKWADRNFDNNAKEIANKRAKGNDSIFNKVKDSLIGYYRYLKLKDLNDYNSFAVSENVILATGFLDMQEARPKLLEALKDSVHYGRLFVRMALARLGDTVLQQQLIAESLPKKTGWDYTDCHGMFFDSKTQLPYGPVQVLFYLNTQESTFALANWLDTTRRFDRTGNGNNFGNCCAEILTSLNTKILNPEFATLADFKRINNFKRPTPLEIENVKTWLLQNKGKYKLNEYYSP